MSLSIPDERKKNCCSSVVESNFIKKQQCKSALQYQILSTKVMKL